MIDVSINCNLPEIIATSWFAFVSVLFEFIEAQVLGYAIHASRPIIKFWDNSTWIAMSTHVAGSADHRFGVITCDGPFVVLANSLPCITGTSKLLFPQSLLLAMPVNWLETVFGRATNVRQIGWTSGKDSFKATSIFSATDKKTTLAVEGCIDWRGDTNQAVGIQ